MLEANARYERFALVGCPIRKSPDQHLLDGSPRLIAVTPRPSSLLDVKASSICRLPVLRLDLSRTLSVFNSIVKLLGVFHETPRTIRIQTFFNFSTFSDGSSYGSGHLDFLNSTPDGAGLFFVVVLGSSKSPAP